MLPAEFSLYTVCGGTLIKMYDCYLPEELKMAAKAPTMARK
jgi:hypothetical protein